MLRGATALGGAPGIEDPRLPHARDLGQVGVAVGDHVASRKEGVETLVPARGAAGIVDEPDLKAIRIDNAPARQGRPQGRLVHVPADSPDRRVGLELAQGGRGREITRVENQVGALEDADAFGRQPPRAPRQMRVSEEGDQDGSARNSPSL